MVNNIFSVSLSDRELLGWVRKMREQGRCPSFSTVLRDGLLKKKQQWELENSDHNPEMLRKRIEDLKKTIGSFNGFLERNKLNQSWFDYNEKELNKSTQKEIFVRKGVETIEMDKSKEFKGKKKDEKKTKRK